MACECTDGGVPCPHCGEYVFMIDCDEWHDGCGWRGPLRAIDHAGPGGYMDQANRDAQDHVDLYAELRKGIDR